MQKRLGIIGGGESGFGAALLGHEQGYKVFVSDAGAITLERKSRLKELNIAFEEGTNTEARLLENDIIVKSPGIPTNAPLITRLMDNGAKVIGEIAFATAFTSATVVGITGSNGKTTTTSLLYHMLSKGEQKVSLGGNIGRSFSRLLVEDKDPEIVVLELSSFQLDDSPSFHPHVSILLNITPDHLDRYEYQFEKYSDSKMQIAQNQNSQDYFIYNLDDPEIQRQLVHRNLKVKAIPFSFNEMDVDGAWVKDESINFHLKKNSFLCPFMN